MAARAWLGRWQATWEPTGSACDSPLAMVPERHFFALMATVLPILSYARHVKFVFQSSIGFGRQVPERIKR